MPINQPPAIALWQYTSGGASLVYAGGASRCPTAGNASLLHDHGVVRSVASPPVMYVNPQNYHTMQQQQQVTSHMMNS